MEVEQRFDQLSIPQHGIERREKFRARRKGLPAGAVEKRFVLRQRIKRFLEAFDLYRQQRAALLQRRKHRLTLSAPQIEPQKGVGRAVTQQANRADAPFYAPD